MQSKDPINADFENFICRPLMKLAMSAIVLLVCAGSPLLADDPSPAVGITVTQLANEGAMISDGETRILIDAMVVEPYSIYGGLPAQAIAAFEQLSGPFSAIDLVLVSHRHHDHNQPRFACSFMQASAHSKLISSPQVLGLMREKCRQFLSGNNRVEEMDPQYEEPHVIELNNVRITVFPLSHGTGKYARLQNYGHLIEIGGLKVLHVGDAAMNAADFSRAGLDKVNIDVALIPFWYFQPGPGSEVIDAFLDAPHKIAVHIPPGEMAEVQEYMRESFPSVAILENPLDQASFSAAPQPPR
jgi:L-ascorbate metabolism protein UlaG (beta-lactamase superfamily)